MQDFLQNPFPFLVVCGIICLQTKGFAGGARTAKRRKFPMVLLIILALMFLLLLLDDHSRQKHEEQGLADYLKIEYRHMYPTSN